MVKKLFFVTTFVISSFLFTVSVEAQTSGVAGTLMTIPHHTSPYSMYWNNGVNSDSLEYFSNNGPKTLGTMWNYQHFTSGGVNNRPFVRYTWWDWDVTQASHDAGQAGWYEAGSKFRPAGGGQLKSPHFFKILD